LLATSIDSVVLIVPEVIMLLFLLNICTILTRIAGYHCNPLPWMTHRRF
jgi:hypothetical protein